MRCDDVRRKITESAGQALSDELKEHIRHCRKCELYSQAELVIQRDLKTAGVNDNTEGLPLQMLRTRVDARVDELQGKSKEYSIMSTMVRQLKRRPRLGISIAVVAVLLAVTTLIPFRLDRIIGYEVAIAGVNKNLAMDSEKISMLLDAIGVADATYTVDGCEVTCQVTLDLKSQQDVQLVLTAFDELDNCVLEYVEEVSSDKKGSLLGHANHMIFKNMFILQEDSNKIHEIVLGKIAELKSDSNGFSIYISEDSDSDNGEDVIVSASGSRIEFYSDASADYLKQIEHNTVEVNQTEDGVTEFLVHTVDGQIHTINFDDPHATQHLQAFGVDVQVQIDSDGTIREVFLCDQHNANEDVNEHENDCPDHPDEQTAKDESSKDTPDAYVLSQNYPNPFNPYTAISFRIAQPKHVTLEIFNINGQRVRTLVDETKQAGDHVVNWDATSDEGVKVASGVYLYRLTAGDYIWTKKMTLLK